MWIVKKIISKADKKKIGELLKAVLDRYAVLFPEWEMSVISTQKGNRKEQLDQMIQLLDHMKDL